MIIKYHGFSLVTAKQNVKDVSAKIYNELNELIYDINIWFIKWLRILKA